MRILQDTEPSNPRDWDNIGDMVCYHPRYQLGDHHYRSAEEAHEAAKEYKVALPLILYDHSGLSIAISGSMRGNHYPDQMWDCSRVGWICCNPKDVRKRIGKNIRQKTIEQILSEEVNEYDSYLRGDYYGYIVDVVDEDDETDDDFEPESCWGFCGTDWFTDFSDNPEDDKSGLWESATYWINRALEKANRKEVA